MGKEVLKEGTAGVKPQDNKMGTQPVGRLLITMALPMAPEVAVKVVVDTLLFVVSYVAQRQLVF